MLLKKPIFIVGFTFGGSNILFNILRSHPDVISPMGETDELFRGRTVGRLRIPKTSLGIHSSRLYRYLPIVLSQGEHVFSKRVWKERKPFTNKSVKIIDKILYDEKLRVIHSSNKRYFKDEFTKYTSDEIVRARLVTKNLSGLIYLSQNFAKMYPDATFLALIRNGLAVCEGHLRRGASIHRISKNYSKSCKKIIYDSKFIDNYHIIKFEDIINNPVEQIDRICSYSNLDFDKLKKIRLETKPVMTKGGIREFSNGASKRELIWYKLNELGKYFNPNVNDNQIDRLSESQKQIIIFNSGEVLRYFSYI